LQLCSSTELRNKVLQSHKTITTLAHHDKLLSLHREQLIMKGDWFTACYLAQTKWIQLPAMDQLSQLRFTSVSPVYNSLVHYSNWLYSDAVRN